MADESYSFSTARTRLEDIVTQVRKKDTSLEKSLDLLEEGVRLANACTELIDHQDWVGTAPQAVEAGEGEVAEGEAAEQTADASTALESTGAELAEETIVVDGVAVIEDVVIEDADGEFVAEVIEITEYEAVDDFVDADDAWADDASDVVDDASGDEPGQDR